MATGIKVKLTKTEEQGTALVVSYQFAPKDKDYITEKDREKAQTFRLAFSRVNTRADILRAIKADVERRIAEASVSAPDLSADIGVEYDTDDIAAIVAVAER